MAISSKKNLNGKFKKSANFKTFMATDFGKAKQRESKIQAAEMKL